MAITFTAGQEVSADDLNAFVPKYINKAADETVSASTTFQDDNHFAAISFGAGETWVCELYLEINASSTGHFKSQWTVTGGATIPSRHILGLPTSTADSTASTPSDGRVSIQSRDYNSSVSNYGDNGSTNRVSYREVFKVVTTTAGTVTYQWAQSSSAGTTTIKADRSFFIAHRVS